jgi:hypothetical protein
VLVGCGSGGGAAPVAPDGSVDGRGDAASSRFSFFVTSLKAMLQLSKSADGFGGDLRFGETGAGAGLRGADKICATIAESSLPGAGTKQWRAFLSAAADENGVPVNAIDRIGDGPWYDRLARKVALRKADLLYDRPSSADAAIQDDLPNEDGVPNHAPDPSQGQVNNRSILTGSDSHGVLFAASATCSDWTSASGTEGRPRAGVSWSDPASDGGSTGLPPGFPFDGGLPPGLDGGLPPGFDGSPPPGFSLDGGIPDGFGVDGLPGALGTSSANWISVTDLGGCAPGVNVAAGSAPSDATTVGSNGGYGGIYCFALTR